MAALLDDECPPDYLCPITGRRMTDPVILSDGNTYERQAIAYCQWISPITGEKLKPIVVTNYAMRANIEQHKERMLCITEAVRVKVRAEMEVEAVQAVLEEMKDTVEEDAEVADAGSSRDCK